MNLNPPRGYRLLIQLDEPTEEEARARLVRLFGPRKAAAAVLRRGTLQMCRSTAEISAWKASTKGFRAYLPKDYRSASNQR